MSAPHPTTLVVIFLRGGADGLALMPPLHDPDYAALRPSLAGADTGLALDGRFTLHPQLGALGALWQERRLALIPACGSDDQTLSHFEAQDLMEHGAHGVGSGWLGRHLAASGAHALQALSMDENVPLMLAAAPGAMAFRCLQGAASDALCTARISALYQQDAQLSGLAATAVSAQARLEQLSRSRHAPSAQALYPDTEFAASLRTLAGLLTAEVLELRAATVDLVGWDTHVAQSRILPAQAELLAGGLAAFARDLGPVLEHVTVVVMSEFGRRAYENTTLGTDHGRGGLMLVLGGRTQGGVHGDWPGLAAHQLIGPGDVAVATDYRQVLATVLGRDTGLSGTVFPDCDRPALAL